MERNWFILGGTGTGRYWLICDSTRSEWSRTGRFMMVLGQYVAVTVGTWWYHTSYLSFFYRGKIFGK